MKTGRVKLVLIACAGLTIVAGLVSGALLLPRQSATAGDTTSTSNPANDRPTGPSGLPVPRYVSLKTDRVNVRRGPSTAHRVIWVYAKQGLPVEIIAESEHWRRVRDSESEEGWVYHSLLSGRRTGLVSPWRKGESIALRSAPDPAAKTVALIQTGVVGQVVSCTGKWCEFSVGGYSGWLQQELLWGVYPDEKID